MLRQIINACLLTVTLVFTASVAPAATSLQVSPVMIDLTDPVGAGLITLRNEGTAMTTVQMRIFEWDQKNGSDIYQPTKDVVASPPMTKLAPGEQQTIRVVRTGKQKNVQSSYRLFVDEIPQKALKNQNGVNLLLRQSIPVFFSAASIRSAKLTWLASIKGAKLTLTAKNTGDDRQRLSQLLIKSPNGTVVARINGLAGYVLGGSTKSWEFDLSAKAAKAGRNLVLTAEHDKGPIRANLTVTAGR